MQSVRRTYRIGKKWTAICKARTIDDAKIIARVANEVGWSAVVYHSTAAAEAEEESLPVDVAENLRRFEDQNDDADLCVQVNALNEGYDNPSICVCIWLCNVESKVTRDQFNGRGLRLYPGFTQEQHPPLTLIYPNVRPLSALMQEYVEMANDMTFVVLPPKAGPTGPGDEDELRWIDIEKGEFFMLGQEQFWEEVKLEKDPVTRAVQKIIGSTEVDAAFRIRLEEKIRSGEIQVQGFDTVGKSAMPSGPEETKRVATEKMRQISHFLRTNGADARRGRSDRNWEALVAKSANIARNDMWPGTERMFSNPNLDLKQLAEFLDADISKIQLYALKRLRELDKRGLCR